MISITCMLCFLCVLTAGFLTESRVAELNFPTEVSNKSNEDDSSKSAFTDVDQNLPMSQNVSTYKGQDYEYKAHEQWRLIRECIIILGAITLCVFFACLLAFVKNNNNSRNVATDVRNINQQWNPILRITPDVNQQEGEEPQVDISTMSSSSYDAPVVVPPLPTYEEILERTNNSAINL